MLHCQSRGCQNTSVRSLAREAATSGPHQRAAVVLDQMQSIAQFICVNDVRCMAYLHQQMNSAHLLNARCLFYRTGRLCYLPKVICHFMGSVMPKRKFRTLCCLSVRIKAMKTCLFLHLGDMESRNLELFNYLVSRIIQIYIIT